jgi:hypothetical protein
MNTRRLRLWLTVGAFMGILVPRRSVGQSSETDPSVIECRRNECEAEQQRQKHREADLAKCAIKAREDRENCDYLRYADGGDCPQCASFKRTRTQGSLQVVAICEANQRACARALQSLQSRGAQLDSGGRRAQTQQDAINTAVAQAAKARQDALESMNAARESLRSNVDTGVADIDRSSSLLSHQNEGRAHRSTERVPDVSLDDVEGTDFKRPVTVSAPAHYDGVIPGGAELVFFNPPPAVPAELPDRARQYFPESELPPPGGFAGLTADGPPGVEQGLTVMQEDIDATVARLRSDFVHQPVLGEPVVGSGGGEFPPVTGRDGNQPGSGPVEGREGAFRSDAVVHEDDEPRGEAGSSEWRSRMGGVKNVGRLSRKVLRDETAKRSQRLSQTIVVGASDEVERNVGPVGPVGSPSAEGAMLLDIEEGDTRGMIYSLVPTKLVSLRNTYIGLNKKAEAIRKRLEKLKKDTSDGVTTTRDYCSRKMGALLGNDGEQ